MPSAACGKGGGKCESTDMDLGWIDMQALFSLSDPQDKSLISRERTLPSSFSVGMFIPWGHLFIYLMYWEEESGADDSAGVWIIKMK